MIQRCSDSSDRLLDALNGTNFLHLGTEIPQLILPILHDRTHIIQLVTEMRDVRLVVLPELRKVVIVVSLSAFKLRFQLGDLVVHGRHLAH